MFCHQAKRDAYRTVLPFRGPIPFVYTLRNNRRISIHAKMNDFKRG